MYYACRLSSLSLQRIFVFRVLVKSYCYNVKLHFTSYYIYLSSLKSVHTTTTHMCDKPKIFSNNSLRSVTLRNVFCITNVAAVTKKITVVVTVVISNTYNFGPFLPRGIWTMSSSLSEENI